MTQQDDVRVQVIDIIRSGLAYDLPIEDVADALLREFPALLGQQVGAEAKFEDAAIRAFIAQKACVQESDIADIEITRFREHSPFYTPLSASLSTALRALEATATPAGDLRSDLRIEEDAQGRRVMRDGYEMPPEVAPAASGTPAQGDGVSDFARDVLAERRRQVESEGWTPEHDDEHSNGEMAQAAAIYAMPGWKDVPRGARRPRAAVMEFWPWAIEWFKPKNRRQDLVRAGALILAEGDRLDRAARSAAPADGGDA